jgi:hypothetical protein
VTISPGVQTLTCQFVPLLSGEFFPHRFSMTFGGQPLVSLRRKDSADVRKLFRSVSLSCSCELTVWRVMLTTARPSVAVVLSADTGRHFAARLRDS